MITYKWEFPAFDCSLDKEGMEKVVTTVHWRYKGTDENDVTAEIYGAQAVGEPNPDAFTPYHDISEEQVIEWMENIMDMKIMNETINEQIDLIKKPTSITLSAPWG